MNAARITAMAALGFLGLSALVGAIPMLLDPSGSPMDMPQSLLQYSPFHSYLIPGILLLGANGLLAFWVFWRVMMARPRHGLWTMMQGCILWVWLLVECLMLRLVIWAHYFYAAVGLVLILSGLALRREEKKTPPDHG
jgi:hypothetical protein